MKVFLSHARKDGALARQLAEQLTGGGFTVWIPEDEIGPGDNWSKHVGCETCSSATASPSGLAPTTFAAPNNGIHGRQSIQFLIQYGEDLLPILLSEGLCVRNANHLLFVYSSSDRCGLRFERGSIS